MIETLNFKVKGKEYPVQVPTVGQYYDIEASKQVLGKGFYNSIIQSNMQTASHAADMIDIEAFMSILVPELMKDLKCKNFKELGVEDYLELKDAYEEQFIPWWENVLKLFNPKK
jgi:broad specificity phosphatase PhoE